MPQLQLPFFPAGMTLINANVGFHLEEDTLTYFYGHLPIFRHDVDDHRSFRMITSQLYINGSVKQSEICRAFGIPAINVKRSVKVYRDKGIAGFFEEPRRRGAAVLTPSVISEVQNHLDQGKEIAEIAGLMDLLADTLHKAVRSGKLHKPKKKSVIDEREQTSCTKSVRSAEDAAAPIGMGATDTFGRIATSLYGMESLPPTFNACHDVPDGGVLLALPALLAMGLLRHSEKYFELPAGFYRLDSIFLVLAFMALARIKSVEKLRYCPPGEWGKLLGLDRIPEAKTLREKIGILSHQGEPYKWAGELGREWMEADPEQAGVLYIDGHVRVYNGHQTKLPRHYVSRQKLCLRATTDYWVNAMDGQPFFVINKEIDPGLLQVLESEIVPRLEADVPALVPGIECQQLPYMHRFILVFDREGYSPGFMKRMRDKSIACQTYNKYPGVDWPEEEFHKTSVQLVSGNIVEMQLAERGVFLGKTLWVREIRKLTESGHQTSIISTDYQNDCSRVAPNMFARWSQENFFKYMREHYNLDGLIDYSTEEISETTKMVNPEYRAVDGKVRKHVSKLNRKKSKFGEIMMIEEISPGKIEAYEQKKSELHEEVINLELFVEELKAERKKTPKHTTMGDLPEEERFRRLGTKSKYLIDTIKMIAYRAETAMVSSVRELMSRTEDARSLIQAIYKTEIDLIPNEQDGTLKVRLHQLANRSTGKIIEHLCKELNDTCTQFPGTKLQLIYELVS